jgi:DNA repair protein RadC
VQSGVKNLSDEELFQLLLERTDADIIHRLLDEMDLYALARLDFGLLTQTYGLGETQSVRLQAAIEIGLRLMKPPAKGRYRIASANDAATLVMPEMAHLDHEQMRVLVLDTKNHLVANVVVYEGTVNSSFMKPSEILRPAVTRRCPHLIVCHSHPSTLLDASPEDIEVTKQCVEAAKLLEIELLDHLIIGLNNFKSLREEMRW